MEILRAGLSPYLISNVTTIPPFAYMAVYVDGLRTSLVVIELVVLAPAGILNKHLQQKTVMYNSSSNSSFMHDVWLWLNR